MIDGYRLGKIRSNPSPIEPMSDAVSMPTDSSIDPARTRVRLQPRLFWSSKPSIFPR